MLDKLMYFSLNNRLLIVVATSILLLGGIYNAMKIPIDVFPDLTAPTVTILTEAHGMAPEEVELLVTFPIETSVNGASGVRRVRSISIQGFSTIYVEFDWGTDIYVARQIINEKMHGIANILPEGVDQPTLAPITSIMGEIMMVGLSSESASLMDLRTFADFNMKRRILSVPGVANVKIYGGEVKQYQVQVNPVLLRKYELSLKDVLAAAKNANINAAGGFFVQSGQEYMIRGLGRIHNIEELKETVITTKNGVSVLLRDIGEVKIGIATPLGSGSINRTPGVLILISKQPDINTAKLTHDLEEALQDMRKTIPEEIRIHTDIFKQADFIDLAVKNVFQALIYGAILVVLVLLLFLGNLQTTIISVIAIPLSLIISVIFLQLFGLSINTMTLGGMAIAVGILVDDAIIYIENVYRRIRQNAAQPPNERQPVHEVIWNASREIRAPIVMATFIIVVVFVPFFFLSGVEGRMLKPLGIAYTISIFASLLVALTITPALSSLFLGKFHNRELKENKFSRRIEALYRPVLTWALAKKNIVIGMSAGLLLVTLTMLPFFGRSFLPEFNEGTFNISVATIPGTALTESNKIGLMAEELLLAHPAITSVVRRTGRTELDEHSLGSHAHEIEVKFNSDNHSKNEIEEDIRRSLTLLPGTIFTIGQPISHRIDHMLSGTRANIAIKIFGPDLDQLRSVGRRIEQEINGIEGIADLSMDQQIEIPQVRIKPDRKKMALFGLTVGDIDALVDIAFLGVKTSEIYEGQNQHDLIVRYAPAYREDLDAIRNSLIDTPTGSRIPLHMVADIVVDRGPNYISREDVQRKMVVQANVSGRDLLSVIDEIKQIVSEKVNLDEGYFIKYGGQFESVTEATRIITFLSIISVLAIFLALYAEFRSFRQSFLIMINLPLALIGGIITIFFTDGIITIASLVGFITLFGIAVRNGIIMVSHYNHLIKTDKKSLSEAIIQGSTERLNPILMTALTTGFALLPLALAQGQPGSEIEAPMSLVILGGLFTASFLNMILIPVLFEKWGLVNG